MKQARSLQAHTQYYLIAIAQSQQYSNHGVFSRFTLEVEIGDYILKHFKMFEPNLNAELARKLRGVSIATVSMKLREPINISTIVVVCVTSVIVLLLIAVIFLIRLRIKSMKRKKSLKHIREVGLLAESV